MRRAQRRHLEELVAVHPFPSPAVLELTPVQEAYSSSGTVLIPADLQQRQWLQRNGVKPVATLLCVFFVTVLGVNVLPARSRPRPMPSIAAAPPQIPTLASAHAAPTRLPPQQPRSGRLLGAAADVLWSSLDEQEQDARGSRRIPTSDALKTTPTLEKMQAPSAPATTRRDLWRGTVAAVMSMVHKVAGT